MCFLFLLLLYLLLSDCLLGKAPLVSLVPSAYIPSMQREQSKSEHHLPIIYRSSKCSLRGHHMFSPKTYAKNLASKEHRLDYSQPFPTLPLRRDTPSHEALHNGYCKWRKNEASLFAHIALDASSFFKKCSFSAIRTAHIRTGSCDEASPAGTLRSIQVKLSCACHVSGNASSRSSSPNHAPHGMRIGSLIASRYVCRRDAPGDAAPRPPVAGWF